MLLHLEKARWQNAMTCSFISETPSGLCVTSSRYSRVYVAYHDMRPVITGQHLIPIQVGRALSNDALTEILGDDSGDNISAQNSVYSELTAHYWVWKNDLADGAIGLMHYRRFIDLADRLNPFGYPERYVINFDQKSYIEDVTRYFSSAEASRNDLVVPRLLHLRCSVQEQYHRLHNADHLRIMREAVTEKFPDFLPDLDMALHGNSLLIGNMFVMQRDVLNHYSPLLFGILDATHALIPSELRDNHPYQKRYLGFLAERILTAYVSGDYIKRAFPKLRTVHKGIVNIDETIPRTSDPLRLARLFIRGSISARDILKLSFPSNSRC